MKLKCNAFHSDAFRCTHFKYSKEKHSPDLQREERYNKDVQHQNPPKRIAFGYKVQCFNEELKSEINIKLQKHVKVSCSFLWAEYTVSNV